MSIETGLVVLVFVVALLPLLVALRVRSRLLAVLWVAVLSALAWATAESRHSSNSRPPIDSTSRPIEVSQDGYVSSDTCRACHPGQYDSWHASYHRTMTQAASPRAVLASFDDVDVTLHGRTYHLERHDGTFWVDMEDPNQPQTRTRRQIVLTTGSHHKQVYWYPTGNGRVLAQLPILYLIDTQTWVARNDAFLRPTTLHPPSEEGRWNHTCIQCHTTRGRPRIDIEKVSDSFHRLVSADSTVAEFGIACESCHGPGEEHIRVNRDPTRRYRSHLADAPDPTIVNPARLSARRSSEVCGQCHSMLSFDSRELAKEWHGEGLPYRPGEALEDTLYYLIRHNRDPEDQRLKEILASDPSLLEDAFWSDGMVRVGGREYTGLLESPCYKHGNEERGVLSCLSCHTMHKPIEDPRSLREWANDQLKEDMETNTACVGCHEGFDSNEELVAHTHHRADSSGSNCNNCHTPHTTYGLLKAIRSHTVDSPSVAVSVKTGRPNACNLCHLDKTLAWTSAHLLEWYGVPSPTLSEDERSIAASVLWILRGDAVQRALLAWSLGWEPARQISGTEWMGLYLSQLIMDPYGAVRFIANRSLGANPGYDAIQFDFVSPEEERTAAGGRVWDLWNRTESQAAAAKGAAVLVTENGNVNKDVFRRLLRERDNRGIVIAE